MKIRSLALITALGLPAVALADPKPPTPATDTKPTTDTKPAKLADGDVKIIAHLHHVNQMEIDLGKLAQKSSNAGVKGYGDTLVKDHQASDKDLVTFTKLHKLTVIPADKPDSDVDKQDDKDMMAKVAHLKTLKGSELDKEFLTMMATGHDKEIARLDVSIGAATDADLQILLKATKPVLQRHADAARDLQKNAQASM